MKVYVKSNLHIDEFRSVLIETIKRVNKHNVDILIADMEERCGLDIDSLDDNQFQSYIVSHMEDICEIFDYWDSIDGDAVAQSLYDEGVKI